MMQLIVSRGFWYFARLQSREIHKNTQNTAKFGRNLIKYMSVQHIWNFSQLLRLFTCCKLVNSSWNFVTEKCKQHPETTGRKLCCEKLGTSHDVKGFAIGSVLEFLERIVVERTAQNGSISNHKIAIFLLIHLRLSLPSKFSRNRSIFPRICP